jgi:hypothetical protein
MSITVNNRNVQQWKQGKSTGDDGYNPSKFSGTGEEQFDFWTHNCTIWQEKQKCSKDKYNHGTVKLCGQHSASRSDDAHAECTSLQGRQVCAFKDAFDKSRCLPIGNTTADNVSYTSVTKGTRGTTTESNTVYDPSDLWKFKKYYCKIDSTGVGTQYGDDKRSFRPRFNCSYDVDKLMYYDTVKELMDIADKDTIDGVKNVQSINTEDLNNIMNDYCFDIVNDGDVILGSDGEPLKDKNGVNYTHSCPKDTRMTGRTMDNCPVSFDETKIDGVSNGDLCWQWVNGSRRRTRPDNGTVNRSMSKVCADHPDEPYCDCLAANNPNGRYYNAYRAQTNTPFAKEPDQCWFMPCRPSEGNVVYSSTNNLLTSDKYDIGNPPCDQGTINCASIVVADDSNLEGSQWDQTFNCDGNYDPTNNNPLHPNENIDKIWLIVGITIAIIILAISIFIFFYYRKKKVYNK